MKQNAGRWRRLPFKGRLKGLIFAGDFWYPNLPKILTSYIFLPWSFHKTVFWDATIDGKKIPENHLGCDRNLVDNGKNYQPQLVSRNQYLSIRTSSAKVEPFWSSEYRMDHYCFLEKKEVRKIIREYIPNPWQKRFHVDTTWAVGKKTGWA